MMTGVFSYYYFWRYEMNKVIVLGALASLLVLAGCASQRTTASDQNATSSAQSTAAPAHHDYKGEKM